MNLISTTSAQPRGFHIPSAEGYRPILLVKEAFHNELLWIDQTPDVVLGHGMNGIVDRACHAWLRRDGTGAAGLWAYRR